MQRRKTRKKVSMIEPELHCKSPLLRSMRARSNLLTQFLCTSCDPYCDRVTKMIENHYDEISFRPHRDFFGSRVTMYVRKSEN